MNYFLDKMKKPKTLTDLYIDSKNFNKSVDNVKTKNMNYIGINSVVYIDKDS